MSIKSRDYDMIIQKQRGVDSVSINNLSWWLWHGEGKEHGSKHTYILLRGPTKEGGLSSLEQENSKEWQQVETHLF